jgi:hypothetical protein
MKVIRYLNNLTGAGASCYSALGMLEECYHITARKHIPDTLTFILECDMCNEKGMDLMEDCISMVVEVVPTRCLGGQPTESFKIKEDE